MTSRKESNERWHDIEEVLSRHGVPEDERMAYNLGDRPKARIDAIIRDIKVLNGTANFRLLDFV